MMADCVVDATIVGMANQDIAAREPGNVFDQQLILIEEIAHGARRLRYNPKLLSEYEPLTKTHLNDVIDLFFTALTDQGILVKRNKLLRHHFLIAKNRCGWPSHDQHLLAAAIDGDEPTIFVTEEYLAGCAPQILQRFGIRVERLA
jgi:hypothetical protein